MNKSKPALIAWYQPPAAIMGSSLSGMAFANGQTGWALIWLLYTTAMMIFILVRIIGVTRWEIKNDNTRASKN